MRKFLLVLTLTIFLFIGAGSYNRQVSAQTSAPPAAQTDGGGNVIDAAGVSPDALTSFTISNPYCYQPNPAVDQCYLNFRYIQVVDNQTTAPYLTWLTIVISNKTRYSATAFFEGTIYYSYDMAPNGFQVPCGAPNAGNAGTQYGYVYSVTVTPLDSSRNSMSTDVANFTCPAYAP